MTVAVAVALALYYVTPSPLLALAPLLVYAGLAWLRLDIALTLLPLTFPFWYVLKHVTAHAVLPLSEVALVVCTGVAIGRTAWSLARSGAPRRLLLRLRGIGPQVGWPLALGAALFALGATVTLLVARRPHEALRAYRWEIAEPLLYVLLLLWFVRGPLALRRLVWAFLASALVVAALAIVQVTIAHVTFTALADGNRLVPLGRGSNGAVRATAIIYGSGNSLGAYMERALPLALAVALAPGGLAGLGRRERVLAAGLGLAYVPALIWSASRGAWAGAGVALVVVACLALGRPWLLAALGALAGLAALWQRHGLVAAALAGHNGSGEERTLLWLAAWHMIRDHPILGIGLDQFLYYYSNRYTSHPYWITILSGHPTIAWREPDLAHPHNLALDLWLSVGLLGLVGFGLVLGVVGWRCLRLWRATSPPSVSLFRFGHRRGPSVGQQRAWSCVVALGLGGSLLASVVHGMVDSAYFVPDLALVFWWSVVVLLVAERCRRT
jgi:hypothetical protein